MRLRTRTKGRRSTLSKYPWKTVAKRLSPKRPALRPPTSTTSWAAETARASTRKSLLGRGVANAEAPTPWGYRLRRQSDHRRESQRQLPAFGSIELRLEQS